MEKNTKSIGSSIANSNTLIGNYHKSLLKQFQDGHAAGKIDGISIVERINIKILSLNISPIEKINLMSLIFSKNEDNRLIGLEMLNSIHGE